MARRLEEVTRGDIDAIRYDDLSFDGSHGHVGVTLFMPSIRQLGIKGEPEIISPYSAGWGEGLGAARASGEGLVRSANVMAATIEYPRQARSQHHRADCHRDRPAPKFYLNAGICEGRPTRMK